MKSPDKKTEFIFYLLASYLLILAFRGFEFASGDMVEVLNYAKHMAQPKLFANDFYVSNIAEVTPNERVIFSGFLNFLIRHNTCFFYVVHFILTITMLIGVYRITSLYIEQKVFRWLTILILFGPLYKINLGGNELYYNMLISSFVAKVFGVWAVYYFLRSKRALAIILILISTIIHPTVGSQLFILIFISIMYEFFKEGRKSVKSLDIFSIIFYLIFAGGYIYMLLKAVHDFGIEKDLYFEIFEFRVPHHFFPQYFPIKSYIVEISLYLFGFILLIKYKLIELLKLNIIIIVGILVYLLGIYVAKIPMILNTQWFKTTIWLELFSLIAVMVYFDQRIKFNKVARQVIFYSIVGVSVFLWSLILSGNSYFTQKPYQFCDNKDLNEEEQLGLMVKGETDENSVFVWPIDFSGFKYYSERGAFVDYKSVVHRGSVLKEWYSRIKMLYGIDINTRRENDKVKGVARDNYQNMNNEKIRLLKSRGVNYIIQYSHVNLDLPVLLRNKAYIVYKVN